MAFLAQAIAQAILSVAGLLPVPVTCPLLGEHCSQGCFFPVYFLLTSLYSKKERVRACFFFRIFLLFLLGLQTSKLFEGHFPDFDVKIASQCNCISPPMKLCSIKGMP